MVYTTANGKDHFNVQTWTGNGSDRTMTTTFEPGFTWIKQRGGTTDHHLYDAVRGATYALASNDTGGQTTKSTGLKSFTGTGFTLGSDSGVNGNSNTYVGWSWKAGSSASNSDGSVTSTVRANTALGFSVAKWTGTGSDGTIGHGLGAVPQMVIIRSISDTKYWMVYHERLGYNAEIYLQSTDAEQGGSGTWNSTTPTSTTISLDGAAGNGVNYSGSDFIGYFFTSKQGVSQVGSYTGNANANGPFVYTGFKPAFVLVRNRNAAHNWFLQDDARLGYNAANHLQKPNTNAADDTGTHIDMLSNGFKTKVNSANCNGSGNIMTYIAFAEAPLVGSNNIPATAR